jgi:hypothetical protein
VAFNARVLCPRNQVLTHAHTNWSILCLDYIASQPISESTMSMDIAHNKTLYFADYMQGKTGLE